MQATPISILLLMLSNVLMTFVVFYVRQPLNLDHLWAGLCIMAAVYFVFRK